jgi:hypothetical protein
MNRIAIVTLYSFVLIPTVFACKLSIAETPVVEAPQGQSLTLNSPVLTSSASINQQNNFRSPEELIKNIFQDNKLNGGNDAINYNDESSVSQYFDEEITRLIMESNACEKRTHRICGMDYNPILGTQDAVNGYSNLKLQRQQNIGSDTIIRVTVTRIGRNQSTDIFDVKYHTRLTKNGWRVSDIDYNNNESFKADLSNYTH